MKTNVNDNINKWNLATRIRGWVIYLFIYLFIIIIYYLIFQKKFLTTNSKFSLKKKKLLQINGKLNKCIGLDVANLVYFYLKKKTKNKSL
jgi:hypothetical protein